MRFIANRTSDPFAKSMMLRIAMGYDAIAQRLMSVPTAPGNGRRRALTDARERVPEGGRCKSSAQVEQQDIGMFVERQEIDEATEIVSDPGLSESAVAAQAWP
jgi:hypothetical protein